MLRLVRLLPLCVAVVISVALWLSHFDAAQRALAANCSQNCEARWVTITEILGGIECEHGPANDPDCPAEEDVDYGATGDCWESNGHVGNCKCYVCGVNTTCEGDIREWMAWCGKKVVNENDGTCPTIDGVVGSLREERAAAVAGGGACNYGSNGYKEIYYCGGAATGGGDGSANACKSSNCAGSGNWVNVDDEPGTRKKCNL